MAQATWDDLAAGRGCVFDIPRPDVTPNWELVGQLTVSSWYLPFNQMYRGHGVVVFDPRHATSIDHLTTAEWHAYAADLHRVVTAIVAVCKPDHMNVESLGNVSPHLHWHVIPRYLDDARWGMPIWTTPLSAMPDHRLGETERANLIDLIRTVLMREAASMLGEDE